MAYTALYRKWRPDNFEDVKGQDHVVTTLKNQIIADRIGHAYLFCGTRGTGKTTIAKIFAKAVNCENPVNGSPCGQCAMCKSIAENRSMNVIEIDAASNNGIDNIRQIREDVRHAPMEGKYTVYIIDEVHALSDDAFNALLKTLEEPPSYIIFILATTEVQSILSTIVSRCQRFDFKRISIETITGRLRELADAEKVSIEDKALRYIAKSADGGMRDALSMMDMCISYYYGKDITYDQVLEVLGAVDTEVFSELLRFVIFGNVKEAFRIIEDVVFEGRDLSQFVNDFSWYLRNLMLVKTSDNDIEEVLDITSESYKRMRKEADSIELDVIMRYLRIFSALSSEIKYSTQKRIALEMAIIRLCKPGMENTTDSLADRVRQIEEKLENGTYVTGTVPTQADSSDDSVKKQEVVKQKTKAPLPNALSEDIKKVPAIWHKVVPKIQDSFLKSMFTTVNFTAVKDNVLTIVMLNNTTANMINSDGSKNMINNLIDEEIGAHVEIEIIGQSDGERFSDSYTDLRSLSEVLNYEIEEEEDDG
ncbi:MAG: DNA polymerase III subunit gamma/tau [Lachnospiraceae bacterium]|nr:DNA polymerase III subunit gamma/tau [Lachnospiraceae bacterium]